MGRSGAPSQEWYEDGLQFDCTCCGRCCSGPPGVVRFSPNEAQAMAALLGLSVEGFLNRYTRLTSEGASLNEVETEHGMDCVFLDRRTVPGKAVCSVYEARPVQCRTFPWWPEHLTGPREWQRLGKRCEGVGRGAFVPVEAIRVQRDRQILAERLGEPGGSR